MRADMMKILLFKDDISEYLRFELLSDEFRLRQSDEIAFWLRRQLQ